MKGRRIEILGILTITGSALVLLSLIGFNPQEDPGISPNIRVQNPLGILGVWVAYFFIKLTFGYPTYILPLLGLTWGWWIFSQKEFAPLSKISGYLLGAMVLTSSSLGLVEIIRQHSNYKYSGLMGGLTGQLLNDFLGSIGAVIVMLALWMVLVRGYFSLSFYAPFKNLKEKIQKKRAEKITMQAQARAEEEKRRHTKTLMAKIDEQQKREFGTSDFFGNKEQLESNSPETNDESAKELVDQSKESGEEKPEKTAQPEAEEKEDDETKINEEEFGRTEFAIGDIVEEKEVNLDELKLRKAPRRKYQLPTADLLTSPLNIHSGMSREDLVERANFLTQSLLTFGVEGKVVNVSPGPVITLFEVEPAEGVRVSKFVALSDDLARVMEASRVRVIAPIPGKSSVGIEIPNRNPDMVYFKSVINSEKFAQAESKLTLAVGKATSGEIATLDLDKMPHLLIAGTTGSGKSVCMNTIISSILYRATPEEVKFVIIDPKKVEMTLYRALKGYHLLSIQDINEPIVTTPENAVLALRALEKEMGRRYDTLAESVVRNIDEYNKRMRDLGKPIMPYIVLLIDELADLIMMNTKEVETPIVRLAQLSRAVGIHLVLATQRPSVDVITGIIKANFPSRIAFQVATKIDSRTIIDQSGAEKLIGRGDMLYLGSGSSEPVRLHNAFLSLEEIEALMNHIMEQPKPDEFVLPGVRETVLSSGADGGNNLGHDELFNEAVRLVVMHQQGSISLLQRRLKVGYSRAARLIDEMEQAGIVGPFTGSKARDILVDDTYLDRLDY